MIDNVSCDDGNSCTQDSCGGKAGCQHKANDGAACDDGNACTSGDVCAAGACKAGAKPTCDDGNPCTVDACDPKTGCTTGLIPGACGDDGLRPFRMTMRYTGKGCAASKHQQGDHFTCNGSPAGASPVTITVKGKKGGSFFSGTVKLGESFTFDAGAESKLPSALYVEIRSAAGALLESSSPHTSCSAPINAGDVYGSLELVGLWAQKPGKKDGTLNGTKCGIGSQCVSQGTCKYGVCEGAKATDCDDSKPCTKDSCDPAKGCQHVSNDGAACDDGDKCSSASSCQAGSCKATKTLDCDDKNPCTIDTCDPKKGKCKYDDAKKGTPCEDGKACTTNDTCYKGTCKAGDDKACKKSDKSDKGDKSDKSDKGDKSDKDD